MFRGKRISLVIPCYNEEGGLEVVLKNRPSFIDEIIVVDNQSEDQTAEVARKYGAQVVRVAKKGYGLAYQGGLPKATGDVIAMMDGDGNHSILDLEPLLTFMDQHSYDFVSGCRFPLKRPKKMPFYKQISNYFITWLINQSFHLHLNDSQCGMIAFKNNLLSEIISSNPGMGFSQELKLNAWTNPKILSSEFQISYEERVGEVKFRSLRDGIRNLYDLYRYLRKKCSNDRGS